VGGNGGGGGYNVCNSTVNGSDAVVQLTSWCTTWFKPESGGGPSTTAYEGLCAGSGGGGGGAGCSGNTGTGGAGAQGIAILYWVI
jgi:hypothetical protein